MSNLKEFETKLSLSNLAKALPGYEEAINGTLDKVASLQARVKELEEDNVDLRQQRAGLAREANAFEAELARLKVQEPVAYSWRSARRAQLTRTIPEGWKQPRELTPLYAEPRPAVCPKCHGTGMTDSGGTQPWGESIEIPCDCQPRFVVKLPDDLPDDGYSTAAMCNWARNEMKKKCAEAIRKAGGEIAE